MHAIVLLVRYLHCTFAHQRQCNLKPCQMEAVNTNVQVTLIRGGQARLPWESANSPELDGVDGAIIVSAVGASFQLAAANESILMNACVRACKASDMGRVRSNGW